jgi:surface carbohydrate biosynthesis protein (TIGR04326 family)
MERVLIAVDRPDYRLDCGRRESLLSSPGDIIYFLPLAFSSDTFEGYASCLDLETTVHRIDLAGDIVERTDGFREFWRRELYRLANATVRGKPLVEWLHLARMDVSYWWLTLMAERNPLKSASLDRGFVAYTVTRFLERYDISLLILGIEEPVVRRYLEIWCRKRGTACRLLWNHRDRRRRRGRHGYPDLYFVAREALLGYGLRFLQWATAPKPRGDRRVRTCIVTYFPHFQESEAARGRYLDNYFGPLGKRFAPDTLVWLGLPVHKPGYAAGRLAWYRSAFRKQGHQIVLAHELLTPPAFLQVLGQYLRLAARGRQAWKELSGMGAAPVVALVGEDWKKSLLGWTLVENLFLFESFGNLFRKYPNLERILYPCEMQAWEKVLIAARNKHNPACKIIGYQHTFVPDMYLHYHPHPFELRDAGNGKHSLPLPDRLLVNSRASFDLLTDSGWDADLLAVVEALRYHHVRGYLDQGSREKRDQVVVLGSIVDRENQRLFRLVQEALDGMAGFELLIKPHPFRRVEQYLEPRVLRSNGWRVTDEPIDRCLAEAKVAVVGSSGAAVDALALGCRVLLVHFPDAINASVLRKVNSPAVWHVTSARELRAAVARALREYDPELQHQGMNLVRYLLALPENPESTELFYREIGGLGDGE